jgi:hypothetical protein
MNVNRGKFCSKPIAPIKLGVHLTGAELLVRRQSSFSLKEMALKVWNPQCHWIRYDICFCYPKDTEQVALEFRHNWDTRQFWDWGNSRLPRSKKSPRMSSRNCQKKKRERDKSVLLVIQRNQLKTLETFWKSILINIRNSLAFPNAL